MSQEKWLEELNQRNAQYSSPEAPPVVYDSAKDVPDSVLKSEYEKAQREGTLDQYPDLKTRYEFENRGNAPDAGTYQAQKRDGEPNSSWDKKAEEGYEVKPGELRSLATQLGNDLNDLAFRLDKIKSPSGFRAEQMGGGAAGTKWVEGSNSAAAVFAEYYGNLKTTINGVIQNLKATADAYETGEDHTKKQVGGVGGNGGGNAAY